MRDPNLPEPGLIVLFGSGETSPTGRKIFEKIFASLPASPNLALLETPAGFELNSHQVVHRVSDFLTHQLQNYSPQVTIIPARKRGTPFSPDNADVISPLLTADLIFMGPGSPTYAVRQLQDSLAWHYLLARHRLGASLALASAASVAISAYVLPVYEIYKVGEDIHWKAGLDFFGLYGLPIVFIPHWNNHDGGAELDTSRCFMGLERFDQLIKMLPDGMNIIGLDEKTALIINPSTGVCRIAGLGTVTLMHPTDTKIHIYQPGETFSLDELGTFQIFNPEASLPSGVWEKALQARCDLRVKSLLTPSHEVIQLVRAREEARKCKDWTTADQFRLKINQLGWEVIDTKSGSITKKLSEING